VDTPQRQLGRLLRSGGASLIVALCIGCSVSAPRPATPGGDLSPATSDAAESALPAPTPGGPDAFASDPRLGQCFGPVEDMEFVFEMAHARDYQLYLPAMLLAPELDVDAPALVVVYRDGWRPAATTGVPGPREATLSPGNRYVCMVVGSDPPILYGDVDINGLTVAIAPSSPGPTQSANAAESPAAGPTPTPAPAWFAGASVLLTCDGEPSRFGVGWQPGDLGTSPSSSAEKALANLIDRVWLQLAPFPVESFRLFESTRGAAAYTYGYRGAVRAVVVARADHEDGTGSWRVTDVATCEPAEFGRGLPTGAEFGAWRDSAGSVVSTEAVSERQDCFEGIRLRVDGRLFVWDPEVGATMNYHPAQLDSTFSADAALPADAVDTGYTSAGRRLHLAADGTAAYLVSRQGITRWPHVKGDEYLRIDCN
jgi:hypothetical protein